ncbi:DUF1150 family protein [Ketogulonicigenium vulgare]|uniref:DUF1150 family protein n=1 Tax=Ketogulonicigenium vulgare (strain WSH-001) TaxID=759362 RepID=F9YAD6_KETVW|nr:DUF1150 family protein [Ketogulonicigenium vulgare]ADO42099.1 conserved domain protein [Ketogulonicigenium vulgare Y25]AEM40309.1 hypothetical protein KVU_0470 [Ketogulonicigenium vulgare WSH-001]ALJ80505.1 hypothetical protein KVH_04520 [Ketogulonicigenium vulgare]ANW34932.1 hypothetical protein KvSKV_04490 [Ketogulonicigenium vulgare]AOZ54019.1 hypothetical protein KVC_1002 [Ketogulonicigenium vulgare]
MNTLIDLGKVGLGEVVYVKPVEVASLPDDVQERIGQNMETVFSIHDAAGEQLALVANRDLAFKIARQYERTPVGVN